MKKIISIIMMALLLMIVAHNALAEDFAVQKENAIAALKVSLPEAVVDFAVRERDDGRDEWDLFFVLGNQLGEGKVLESTNEIRKVTLYEKPDGVLTAGEAMARLSQLKGNVVILDLELDRDDGGLFYEGEAELDGKRYEFEMTAAGEIIEWERD